MSTDFNAVVDVGRVDPEAFDLDAFAAHSGVLAGSPLGTAEVILTLPAESLGQAAITALALVTAAGYTPRAVRVMTAAAFDAEYGLDPADTISVTQAAAALGVTTSAVRQRLGSGSLPGSRDGRDWRLPRIAIEREAARRAAS